MGRFVVRVVAFFTLIACLTGQAQLKDEYWQGVPTNQKTEFSVSGWGNRFMYIQCFISTLDNWRLFWGEKWDENRKTTEFIQTILEATFPEQSTLFVVVANGSKSQYFWPTEFVFTQGSRQYGISYSDVLPFSKDDPFAGGEMKPYIVTEGFIAIPKGIDVTKPFKIWYGDDFGVLDPTAQTSQ